MLGGVDEYIMSNELVNINWQQSNTDGTPSPPGQGPADPLTTGAGPDGILMRANRFNKGTMKMALPWREKYWTWQMQCATCRMIYFDDIVYQPWCGEGQCKWHSWHKGLAAVVQNETRWARAIHVLWQLWHRPGKTLGISPPHCCSPSALRDKYTFLQTEMPSVHLQKEFSVPKHIGPHSSWDKRKWESNISLVGWVYTLVQNKFQKYHRGMKSIKNCFNRGVKIKDASVPNGVLWVN